MNSEQYTSPTSSVHNFVKEPQEIHEISVFRAGQMVIVAYWMLQLLKQSLEVMQLASTCLVISCLKQNDSDYYVAHGNY